MSRVLYVCYKGARPKEFSVRNLFTLSKRLEPDNISYPEPEIISSDDETIAIFNSNNSIRVKGISVCLGNLHDSNDAWWKPGSNLPDGTYALFRANQDFLEVITDMVATRTIWYYHDTDLFISSTSQRAIVFFLRSFQFNPQALSWMLSTGTLGPGHSWDKRIKMLEGNSSLLLNRNNWDLKISSGSIDFSPVKRSDKLHLQYLNHSIKDSFDSLDLDFSKWILLLSGGYDSRAIFSMLKEKNELRCVTWGLESSLMDRDNDAYIAKKLAGKYRKNHKYYLTDLSKEPVEKIFHRFLVCSEGRLGDIGAYLDGFRIWKELYEENINGIIRGDEGFGGECVLSEVDVRHHMRFTFFSDFANLKSIHSYGIPEQKLPTRLIRNKQETLKQWRDRLNHQYEMPVVFAALNDLKLAYVEVINPLLTRTILSAVRTLPDKLRSNKKIFRKIVKQMEPDLKFAKNDATAKPDDVFSDQRVMNAILSELKLLQADTVIPPEYTQYLLHKLNSVKHKNDPFHFNFKNRIKRLLPAKLKNLLRSSVAKVTLDYNALAFRTYIISKMNRMLIEDSNACLKE